MRRQRGFTLMELMIAITLVAAISAGILMAMRTGLQTMQKVNDRITSDRRVLSMQQILQHQLSNAMPVLGLCGEGVVFSFNGTEQTMHLVSSYSMSEGARGFPRVIELQVTTSDRGGWRLIANEALYTGPASTGQFCGGGLQSARSGPGAFIVADRLAYCRFSYQDIKQDSPQGGGWGPVWTKAMLPAAVRVDMAPMSADAAHLPLLPVTARILITRGADFNNNDYW